jgi:HK97 gp10 family phage protein
MAGPVLQPGDVIVDQAAVAALVRSDPIAADLARKAVTVEGAAKRLCPVDTGRLRASISHRLGEDAESLFADVGTAVEYAPHVEFGTERMAARPYLRPALDAIRGEAS